MLLGQYEMMKKASKDFPSPLYNYKDKGFEVEMMGTETIEGTETFKLKLTQDPITVDGKEEANVSYYYFETEKWFFVLILFVYLQICLELCF